MKDFVCMCICSHVYCCDCFFFFFWPHVSHMDKESSGALGRRIKIIGHSIQALILILTLNLNFSFDLGYFQTLSKFSGECA